ncbi:MAG: GNAT family N-acetyltransferase, partial [Rhodoferax sp.]
GFTQIDLEIDASMGAAGKFVRAFRKTQTPRWQLRHLRDSDYPEIAVLFEEIFGHPLSPELWAWKYSNGHGNAVLASRNGELVAHYGGMYREILMFGKPEWAYGGSDVMVHPKERGVMTRQGPFLLTAATTAELYGPVAFGFPTERAMLVAEKMGLYTKAGKMAEVRWTPSAPRPRLRTRVQALARENAEDKAVLESLWDAMASDLGQGVVGLRDWSYIEHRYFDHPHNHYDVLAVKSRLTGKALGVLAMRRLEDSCELLDVIAPLDNLPLVIDQARRMTALWSLPYLYCWITTNYAPTFVACDGKEQDLNVFIPTSCWTDDPRVDMLKDKWWLMSGDTDFR